MAPVIDETIVSLKKDYPGKVDYYISRQNKALFFLSKCFASVARRFEVFKNVSNHIKSIKRLYISNFSRISLIHNFSHFILFDFYGLGSVTKCKQKKCITVFSLELEDYLKNISKKFRGDISFLISQSNQRAEYLDASATVLIVPNSYQEPIISNRSKETEQSGLIYSGTICKAFGQDWLQSLADFEGCKNLRLVFHGRCVDESIRVLQRNHLVLDAYLSDFELQKLLESCAVGLIFYDSKYIDASQKFNFETAPSGKLFKYLSSGIPVIVNSCDGMKVVTDFGAGIELDCITPESVLAAYKKIINNYDHYQSGCRRLMNDSMFVKKILPYMDHLSHS
jgi:glycosyltransferase involved in cell wall biosynthesis